MCLGIPGKVIEIDDSASLRMAKVDFGGVRKEACLAYVPDVKIGDYVIVHVGFAISQLDEEEAMKTLEILRMIDEVGLEQELGSMADEAAGAGAGPADPSTPAPSTPAPPGASAS